MADSSFELDNRQNRHTTTPTSLYHASPSTTHFSFTDTSHSFISRRPRRGPPPPTTPFATDDDRSWQGELSWQFQPTGWQDNRNLGAVFSPWTPSAPSSNFRVFKRSANDYYHGGFRSYVNPQYDTSYSAVPSSGRLELQSHVAEY